jgi:hypothetical protein
VHACNGAPETHHRRHQLAVDISHIDNRGFDQVVIRAAIAEFGVTGREDIASPSRVLSERQPEPEIAPAWKGCDRRRVYPARLMAAMVQQ